MKKENKFITVFSVFIVFLFISGYLLYSTGTLSHSEWIAFLTGSLSTTFNFILGLVPIRIGINSSQKKFLIIVFGGILIRMTLMLAVVYLALKFLQISANVFIFVIFVFYTFYLFAEIFYLYLLKERKNW